MEGYKVICLVGEGSFGRVFKAKKRDSKEIVALKIIRKCGRTQKELLSLRSECEIQKHLHHKNIIKMINSFETENEIVVVTEFCKRDLHYILSKQTYLSEETALPIVCDLVSALYYLHSNRVLHRDLKPQNVLINKDGVAKLCDFGFARSMSRGTHVLTSIKGTPLYMAPELIEESPYDHNADLWSLGCIVYEMVVGVPPFTTTSILQLVRMIRYEPVAWPNNLSPSCRDLLQGLLHKDPARRLSWPLLLQHPFLQHRVSSSLASEASLPLTKELTSSQALAKEHQKLDLANKIDNQNQGLCQKIQRILDHEKKMLAEGGHQTEVDVTKTGAIDLDTLEQKLSYLKTAGKIDPDPQPENAVQPEDRESQTSDEDSGRATTPLETEEWLAFLQQTMREVMRGDVESMSEKSFITMVTNALTHHGSTPKVSEYIACLLSLPYVAPGVTQTELATITMVISLFSNQCALVVFMALTLFCNKSRSDVLIRYRWTSGDNWTDLKVEIFKILSMAARKYLNLKNRLPSSSSSSSSNVASSILLQTLTMDMISATQPSYSGQACHSGRDEDVQKSNDDDAKPSPPPASPDRNSTKSSSSTSSSSSSLFLMKAPPILSPLTPPTPLRNQPLSDKCKKILSIRKKSFQPLKSCSYLFKKGGKKGEHSTRPCISNEVLCGLHLKMKDKSNTSHCAKQTAETLYTTRINRLRRFQKYFFVKVIEHITVIVRCGDKKYILRLPKGMINPESPTERHYLIRDSSGTVVWKKDKI